MDLCRCGDACSNSTGVLLIEGGAAESPLDDAWSFRAASTSSGYDCSFRILCMALSVRWPAQHFRRCLLMKNTPLLFTLAFSLANILSSSSGHCASCLSTSTSWLTISRWTRRPFNFSGNAEWDNAPVGHSSWRSLVALQAERLTPLCRNILLYYIHKYTQRRHFPKIVYFDSWYLKTYPYDYPAETFYYHYKTSSVKKKKVLQYVKCTVPKKAKAFRINHNTKNIELLAPKCSKWFPYSKTLETRNTNIKAKSFTPEPHQKPYFTGKAHTRD